MGEKIKDLRRWATLLYLMKHDLGKNNKPDNVMRLFLIVLQGVSSGDEPNEKLYLNKRSNTASHISKAVNGLKLLIWVT